MSGPADPLRGADGAPLSCRNRVRRARPMAWRGVAAMLLLAAAAAPMPVAAQPGGDPLPSEIVAVIRKQHAAPDDDTRYLDATIDLNADGRPERVVHVVGPTACGSGGCPTLVFTPERSGHRLVSTISSTQPPIRAGRGRVKGWRNLIVRVGGGATRERDVALSYDGRRYPGNPTVKGPSVAATRARDTQVLIATTATAANARLLPKAGSPEPAALAGAAVTAAAGPTAPVAPPATPPMAGSPPAAAAAAASFDCASASTRIEKAICSDAALAALDRRMGDAFDKAMRDWPPDERTAQRAAQRNWIARLNACASVRTPRPCLESSYRQRLIEVQIQGGQLEAARPVGFVCKGHESEPMTATFYNQTDPKSALITFGKRQVIAFIAPSASGARYLGDDLEFWEHQGEALVTWSGKPYGCKLR